MGGSILFHRRAEDPRQIARQLRDGPATMLLAIISRAAFGPTFIRTGVRSTICRTKQRLAVGVDGLPVSDRPAQLVRGTR